MSYDVHLEVDAGGPETVECYWRNHTSNTSRMWRDAGADIAEMYGKPAGECARALASAADRIETHPDLYSPMESPNGWGTRESTVLFLRDLADACERFPKATVRVSR